MNLRKNQLIVVLLFVVLYFTQPTNGLSDHFLNWQNSKPAYAQLDLNRTYLRGGSYGGKDNDTHQITKTPIVFIHASVDVAYGETGWTKGWRAVINYLLTQGYTSAELYTTTWGKGDSLEQATQYHSKTALTFVRKFIEAVLEYTGAPKIHVVAHGMGVTVARKAIKGGYNSDLLNEGRYYLGSSLRDSIETFIGISGVNWGLIGCFQANPVPHCSTSNGFYPGTGPGPIRLSDILTDINYNGGREASHVFSVFSLYDELIGYHNLVWGRYTSQIPGQDDEVRLQGKFWTHVTIRDTCGPIILHLIEHKKAEGYQEKLVKHVKEDLGNQIHTYILSRERSKGLRMIHAEEHLFEKVFS